MKMKSFFYIVILIPFISCNTIEPPPPDNRKITLTFEDASCIEVWMKIDTENITFPAELIIKRDDTVTQITNLSYEETVVYIDSLFPNTTYTIQAFIYSSNQSELASNELTVTTMDTTSHNFNWQTWTFGGDVGSSTFYDVAIINENSIWAVGEIKIRDSIANETILYNAAYWDGNEWTLHRIMFYTICGQPHQNAYRASSIIAFSESEIWVSLNGDQIAKIENGVQTRAICIPWTFPINKIWGTSSNDLYVVGNNGNIANYQNGHWTRIESGTSTNINDIWGVFNPITQEQIIYCPVSFVYDPGDQKILTIKNNKVDSLSWNIGKRLHSVWSKNGLFVYTAGGGFHENKRGYWNEINIAPYYGRNIRGTDYNNIFVCGDYGLFAHFNGSTWQTYNELYIQGIYYSIAMKNNIVVIVGFEGSKAIIIKGIRN